MRRDRSDGVGTGTRAGGAGTRSRRAVFGGTVAVLVILAVTAGAVLSAPAGAQQLRARPERVVTPQRWQRAVCVALGDWGTATGKGYDKVTSALDALAAGKSSAKTAKVAVLKAYADAVKATDALTGKVKAAGTPALKDGPTVAKSFLATVGDLRTAITNAQRSYTQLPVRDNAQFLQSAKGIEDTGQKAASVIGDPLEGLRASPELADVIKNDPACTSLTPPFTPTSLKVGDCVSSSTSANPSLDQLEVAPCAAPHLAEVLAVLTYPGGATDPYPGADAVGRFADSSCQAAFQTYIGIDFNSSTIDLSSFAPTKDSWPVGDRQLVCLAGHKDGSTLTGSVRGTAR
jgi:hypothetical protein